KDKARRLVGQMQLVEDASERFKLYLLIGKPTHIEAEDAFLSARRMLDRLRVDHEIFTEDQAAEVSEKIAAEIADHDRARIN
ncbi:MAG: hypothetical protein ACKVQK_23325, partial [Burkholderiales bacterium]